LLSEAGLRQQVLTLGLLKGSALPLTRKTFLCDPKKIFCKER
jgi:hypothetical protein